MMTKNSVDARNRKEFLTRGRKESCRLMTCNEAGETARLTRGEKLTGECGDYEVDSMTNWQPVERTEFNGNRVGRGAQKRPRPHVLMCSGHAEVF